MNRVGQQQLADRILLYLRSRPKRKVELKALVKRFRTELADINTSLRILHEWGYQFRQEGSKISFTSAPDILAATEIGYKLQTKFVGKIIHSFNTVKSTNDIACQLAEKGALEGTIVTAEKQTLGRGRLGRSWHSPEKMGIYVSIILRPKFPPEKAPGLSIMTALAVAEAIDKLCAQRVQIKWPNDVLISSHKVAGVLTELVAEKNKIGHIIIGIGINANQQRNEFPPSISETATSIRNETGQEISRVSLLKDVLGNFEKLYRFYKKSQLTKLLPKIKKYSSLLGQEISVQGNGSTISGRAVDIDKSGVLIIEWNGIRTTIASGEVTVVKKS